jgi:hypothetical protein
MAERGDGNESGLFSIAAFSSSQVNEIHEYNIVGDRKETNTTLSAGIMKHWRARIGMGITGAQCLSFLFRIPKVSVELEA